MPTIQMKLIRDIHNGKHMFCNNHLFQLIYYYLSIGRILIKKITAFIIINVQQNYLNVLNCIKNTSINFNNISVTNEEHQ